MKRAGFTLTEMMIVIALIATITAMSLPRLFAAIYKTNARSARVAFGTLAVKARAVAVQRGCVATLNFTTGSAGVVWVTACKVGQTSGIDTVGTVDRLAQRYGVSVSAAAGSLQYDPRGLSIGYQPLTVVFTTTSGGATDSTVINQLGKVVH